MKQSLISDILVPLLKRSGKVYLGVVGVKIYQEPVGTFSFIQDDYRFISVLDRRSFTFYGNTKEWIRLLYVKHNGSLDMGWILAKQYKEFTVAE